MNHQTNINLFKDITLLYELSLSIGHSFDMNQNINAFMQILMERKNIDLSSVWMKAGYLEDAANEGDSYRKIYSNPSFRGLQDTISASHPMVKALNNKKPISVSYQSPEFDRFITEDRIHNGVYTFFRLGNLGFIKLYQYARHYEWSPTEQNKLLKVISQFTYSLQACLDHDLKLKETQKRIQTEQQLKKREKDFLDVINTIDDVFYAFDVKTNRFSFLSPTFETLFGLKREDVYNNPLIFDSHTSTDEHGQAYSFTREILSTKHHDREFTYTNSYGRKIPVWSKHNIIYDDDGKANRIVGTLRDISEKNRIMSQLEYRLMFEDLILDISSSFINLKADDIDVNIDNTLERIGQFVKADRTYIFFIHSDDKLMSNRYEWCDKEVTPEIDNLQNLPIETFPWWISRLKNFETINLYDISTLGDEAAAEREILQNQSIKSLAVIPMILQNKLLGFIGFDFVKKHTHFTDDTIKLLRFIGQIVINAYDRKIHNKRNTHHEHHYQNIVESASDIIYRLDATRRFKYMNEKALATLGFSYTELAGMNFEEIIHPKYARNVDRYYSDQLEKDIDSTYLEFPILTRYNNKVWIGQNTSLFTYADGSKELTAVARDITDVIRANESLKAAYNQSEKANQSKTQFVVNTSHEVRSPAHAISGLVRRLSDTNLSNEQKEILSMLSNTSRSLNNLVDNIIDFKKIEAETIDLSETVFDLRDTLNVVTDMLRFQADNNQVNLISDVDENIPKRVKGDEGKLQRIIINLTENAIKFNEKGYARIAIAPGKKNDSKTYYDFTVEDDGIGFPEGIREQIKSTFAQDDESTTRLYDGAGLGLFISAELINYMGGSLQIERPDKGARIRFSIPFETAQTEKTSTTSQNPTTTFPGTRVLLVEDNKINRIVASKALEKLEIEHDLANNGKQALDLLKENHYDAILMDLMMPEMDGFEASQKIRSELHLNMPIIACTAKKVEETIEECYAAGMNDYIAKPFNENDIREKLNELLE